MNPQTDLPEEVQLAIGEASKVILISPTHEMGQNHRRRIYRALHSTPRGEVGCQWLALLAAQRVLPIYEHALAKIDEYREKDQFGVNAIQKPRYMLKAMEQVIRGMIPRESISEARYDFYGFMHIGLDKRVPYLALSAAYEAVCEVMGAIPLQTQVSKAVRHEDGTIEYVSSDQWTDEELAGAGANADDAAVNAAYAYAQNSDTSQFDYQKVLEFWSWWLEEAIPQAWKMAGEMSMAG
jgi:immunity protein Imm5 of predicted polymorphic toxin system